MRGIGVAVSTSRSTASPLRAEREPLVHAEAVLLVDDRQREIAERDVVLEQRMGADDEIDIAGGKPGENVVALAAALAAGEDGEPDAGGLAPSGAMVAKCCRARISVGAMNAACRPASITCAAASSATTVLPEPTSPCSSRSMRCGCARSATMSVTARACDGVSE